MELQQTGTQIGIQDNDSGLDSSVAHDGMEIFLCSQDGNSHH